MSLYLCLLGGPRLESEGEPVRGRAAHRRRLAVLALLASARSAGRMISRKRIIALLWPEAATDVGRKLLSESLYVLRKELGDAVIQTSGDEVGLDDVGLPCDVVDFQRARSAGDLELVALLYKGPFLDGWYVDDAPDFERWAERERDRLHREYVSAVEALAKSNEQRGDWPAALANWRALADADRFSGRIALGLARAQVAAGERAAALQSLAAYEATLRTEMEAPPDAEVIAYVNELRSAAPSGSTPRRSPAETPALGGELSPPTATVVAPQARRPAARWSLVAVVAAGVAVAAAIGPSLLRAKPEPSVFMPHFDPNEVAVRPFRDLTGRNQSLAYALTDELIRRLTGVPPIRVASRTAVLHSADSTIGVDSVARALHVGTVIEGTITEANDKVSVTALITDVSTGRYVGAAEVKADRADYFTIVDELAAHLERDFRHRLGETFRFNELTRGTSSADATRLMAEAQRAIDLARETGREWRPDAGEVSRRYLVGADSVLALAQKADVRWPQPLVKRALVASMSASLQPSAPSVNTLDTGIAMLDRALRLDPVNAAAFELRGRLRFQKYLTYAKPDTSQTELHAAVADYERAKSRDSLRVGAWIGRAFMAWYVKDTVAARRNLEGAARLDAYLEGETDLLSNQFVVALWLRDWSAAEKACRAGRRQDPWNYRFLQCELTLARHDTLRTPNARWAWAVVDTLNRMHPPEKAGLTNHEYVPLYWRTLAATISLRAGKNAVARVQMDSVLKQAKAAGVLDDLAPDRAYFEWRAGDRATAMSLMKEFLQRRPQERPSVESDALLGPIVEALGATGGRGGP